MNLQELQTVVGNDLPLKIVVINNEGYLSIKMTQESFFQGKQFATGPDSGVTLPNMKKMSSAFGIDYYCIKNNSQIDEVMNKAMSTNTPSLIATIPPQSGDTHASIVNELNDCCLKSA